MGWLNPGDADNNKNGFLTLLVEFETANPDLEFIKEKEWLSLAKYSFEE